MNPRPRGMQGAVGNRTQYLSVMCESDAQIATLLCQLSVCPSVFIYSQLGARSVEALYVGGATGHNQLASNVSQQHASSDAGLSTTVAISTPITTTSGSVAVTSMRERSTEDDLIGWQ